jgi:hypothetical protein
MAVNPEKHKHVKFKEAMEFVNWMISKEGQQTIGSFKDKNGNSLFIPNASENNQREKEMDSVGVGDGVGVDTNGCHLSAPLPVVLIGIGSVSLT